MPLKKLTLFVKEITDPIARENFKKLREFLKDENGLESTIEQLEADILDLQTRVTELENP